MAIMDDPVHGFRIGGARKENESLGRALEGVFPTHPLGCLEALCALCTFSHI